MPASAPPGFSSDLLAEQRRMVQRMLHLPRLAEMASGTRVGVTPRDVVLERPGWKLLRYRRTTPASYAEPVLFCYALINRSYILDLLPDRSVVARYLERGFDVYMIDWTIPGPADRDVTIERYVCGFIKEAVDFILAQHQRRDLHLLGYCMGGTLSVLFAALEPDPIRTLTLLAAPLDFAGESSLLQLWTKPDHFDVDTFIDRHGNCPAWFLQTCFLLMKPVQNLLEKNLSLYELMDEEKAIAGYFAMEHWINDNVPIAGATFREFVKRFYQGNELVRGEYQLARQRVDLRRISAPLLLLTASKDHLVAPSSTEGICPHVGSRDIRSISIDAGHVGLVVSGKAQRIVWPEATAWLAQRSTAV